MIILGNKKTAHQAANLQPFSCQHPGTEQTAPRKAFFYGNYTTYH